LEITETRSGDLWLGQNAHLVNVRPGTGQVTVYGHDQEGPLRLAGGQVFALLEDSRGNLWIGGEGGLAYLPKGHEPGAPLVSKSGLPNPVVTSLVEDAQGNLWTTTHAGLSKLVGVVQDPSSRLLTHFDVHDGLQDNEFSRGAALRTREGRLYFGGRRGFNSFFPDQVPTNTTPPPIVLTDLRVLGRSIRPGQPSSILRQSITETTSLSISQDLFALTFEFAALNLVQPNKNRYAFMLEGLESTWNEAGSRAEATYTQLRHGDYVLRVRAANNDGVWNEAGLALRLHVEPRWHERAWIRVTLVLLGLLMVAGVLRWRARQFRARERELTLRVDERTHALHELNEQLEQRVRQRTAELEEEKQRLSVTMGSIADAVVAADVDGHVGLMNRVAEQLSGFRSETALGRPLAEIIPRLDPNTRQPLSVSTLALLPGDTPPSPRESLLVRPDGKELLIAESAAPIRDHQGTTLGVVLAFRDITQQRRLELHLASNEKLEALGVLAGGIAHDFNNLLAGLFGYLELSQLQAPGSPKQRETMGKAISLIDKGRGLTSKLLTFSKGEAPQLVPIDLREVLSRSAEFALNGSNVVCAPRLAEDLWLCLGDRQQIDQVFDNLLLNARHAMADKGEVTISADNVTLDGSVIPALPPGRYLRVSVADQGPGIAKELQGRIFEPFFTTKIKGTGLGLATTHSIVRRHKGHIEVSSEPGKGAVFTVTLPAVDAEPQIASHNGPVPGTRPLRVLLLDDEASVRETLAGMLSALGHTVEAVADGTTAVETFRAAHATGQPFDLALLDLTIPDGAGGREVLERLLAIQPTLKAVALSGYSPNTFMNKPGAHGFMGTVGKPCTIDDLAQVVGRSRTQQG
jgi:PAS domain S-box-containing protein